VQHSKGPVGLAVFLWLVVVAGLAYGVSETLRKVAALFTG
jgi:hypothetical protein